MGMHNNNEKIFLIFEEPRSQGLTSCFIIVLFLENKPLSELTYYPIVITSNVNDIFIYQIQFFLISNRSNMVYNEEMY